MLVLVWLLSAVVLGTDFDRGGLLRSGTGRAKALPVFLSVVMDFVVRYDYFSGTGTARDS